MMAKMNLLEGHTFNSYSAGIDFIRQNLPSVVVDPSHRYSNESERPKMISNLNKPFGLHDLYKINPAL